MKLLNKTYFPQANFKKIFVRFLDGCSKQGLEWIFDQIARQSLTLLLLIIGYIYEAAGWF